MYGAVVPSYYLGDWTAQVQNTGVVCRYSVQLRWGGRDLERVVPAESYFRPHKSVERWLMIRPLLAESINVRRVIRVRRRAECRNFKIW